MGSVRYSICTPKKKPSGLSCRGGDSNRCDTDQSYGRLTRSSGSALSVMMGRVWFARMLIRICKHRGWGPSDCVQYQHQSVSGVAQRGYVAQLACASSDQCYWTFLQDREDIVAKGGQQDIGIHGRRDCGCVLTMITAMFSAMWRLVHRAAWGGTGSSCG